MTCQQKEKKCCLYNWWLRFYYVGNYEIQLLIIYASWLLLDEVDHNWWMTNIEVRNWHEIYNVRKVLPVIDWVLHRVIHAKSTQTVDNCSSDWETVAHLFFHTSQFLVGGGAAKYTTSFQSSYSIFNGCYVGDRSLVSKIHALFSINIDLKLLPSTANWLGINILLYNNKHGVVLPIDKRGQLCDIYINQSYRKALSTSILGIWQR